MSYQTSLFALPGIQPIQLRPYQRVGIDRARALIRAGNKRILLVLPTGGGKTIVAASIISGTIAKGKRILFVGPRREIIAQTFWKLIDAGVTEFDAGVIMGNGWITDRNGSPYSAKRPTAPAQVASIQTLTNRALPPADVVFWDEAHHCVSETHARVIKHYAAQGAVIIGLTATPIRADGQGFKGTFDVLEEIATARELMDQGWLAEPLVLGPKVSFSDVKGSNRTEYQEALDQAISERVIVGDLVEHWQREARGLTAVAFASSVDRSKAIAAAFCAVGVRAEHLDGNMSTDQRDAILRRLATGETTMVTNMGVLTEGWDLPRVKCALVARPTSSLSLWLQMCGRVLRPWEGIRPVILDHGGNWIEHGRPQDKQPWSLDGIEKRKSELSESVRQCPDCAAPLEPDTEVCPNCGHVFTPEERQGPAEVDGTLVEVTEEQTTVYKKSWYRDVLTEAFQYGRKVGWARHRYRERFGDWPRFYRDEEHFFPKRLTG